MPLRGPRFRKRMRGRGEHRRETPRELLVAFTGCQGCSVRPYEPAIERRCYLSAPRPRENGEPPYVIGQERREVPTWRMFWPLFQKRDVLFRVLPRCIPWADPGRFSRWGLVGSRVGGRGSPLFPWPSVRRPLTNRRRSSLARSHLTPRWGFLVPVAALIAQTRPCWRKRCARPDPRPHIAYLRLCRAQFSVSTVRNTGGWEQ